MRLNSRSIRYTVPTMEQNKDKKWSTERPVETRENVLSETVKEMRKHDLLS